MRLSGHGSDVDIDKSFLSWTLNEGTTETGFEIFARELHFHGEFKGKIAACRPLRLNRIVKAAPALL